MENDKLHWEDIKIQRTELALARPDSFVAQIPFNRNPEDEWKQLFKETDFDGPCKAAPEIQGDTVAVVADGTDDGILGCIDALVRHVAKTNGLYRTNVLGPNPIEKRTAEVLQMINDRITGASAEK